MKILLLGVGMQGKAALADLARSVDGSEVVVAAREIDALRAHIHDMGYGPKVRPEVVDAADPGSIDRLLVQGPDVIIDLLPVPFSDVVAEATVARRLHLVNTIYTSPGLRRLAAKAQAKGIALLPEFGLDPGIDLAMLGQAAREGVLASYRRDARLIRDGCLLEIDGRRVLDPEHIHKIDIEGIGQLEAFPNGDALPYADLLGLEAATLDDMGRYTMRWPGHGRFWRAMVDLGLLEDEPVMVDGVGIDRKRFLAAALEPQLQLGPAERDIIILRVEVWGRKDGRRARAVYQLIDRRDLGTGQTAMSRTVGFTASIGAQLIGRGAIAKRGLLSPVTDVPYDVLVGELAKRNIQITSAVEKL